MRRHGSIDGDCGRMATGAWIALAAAGLAIAIAAGPRAADAAALASGQTKTHLGAAAKDVVVLQLGPPGTIRRFYRVLPDGSTDAAPFSPPRGSVLHVTDVEYTLGWNNPGRGTGLRSLRIEIVNDSDANRRATVAYPAALASNPPDTGSTVMHVGSSQPQQGFVVGFGAHLEADAPEFLLPGSGAPQGQPLHGDVVLRGYLLRDR